MNCTITYDSEFISEKQKRIVEYYIAEEGYSKIDLAWERKQMAEREI